MFRATGPDLSPDPELARLNPRLTIAQCPADFVKNLQPMTHCICQIQLQVTCIPARLAGASRSVSHGPVPYQQWPSNLARFTAASVDTGVTEAFKIGCSLPGSQSVDGLRSALRNNSTPFRSLSTTVPAFCKATARQRTIRSNRGIGQYRRARRSDNPEHAPSDEIRAVSVRAPNADRFRRPRRARFSASPVAER